MAQNHLQFDGYTPPDVDEDGYTIAFAATSSDDSGRLMNGKMVNTRLFTVEAYNLKWTDITLEAAAEILSKTVSSLSSISIISISKPQNGRHMLFMLQTLTQRCIPSKRARKNAQVLVSR